MFLQTLLRKKEVCAEMLTILFFWIYDPIPILLSKVDLQSDPILSSSWEKDLRSDPFRSFPIRSLSCILKDTVQQILRFLNLRTCESERFISNKIARSHKIVILLRNANFNLKNAVCLWKITEWKIYFFIFHKNFAIFRPKRI